MTNATPTLDVRDLCVYCGQPARTKDHVIPRAWKRAMDDIQGPLDSSFGLVVPACSECNSLLGASVEHTVASRRAVVRRKLRKKYRRLIGSPTWTAPEIASLGEELRSAVEATQAQKKIILTRLRWGNATYTYPKQPKTLSGKSPRVEFAERLKADILTLRKRGLVPLAIADILDVADTTVAKHLRALISEGELAPLPRYLDSEGPEREIVTCRHCGEVQ